MKNSLRVKQIVYDALFLALIALFTLVPNLGYIQLGPSSFQFISVIVIIGAALFGWKRGLLYGFFFGFFSLVKVLISAAGWFDALFIFPWNSILPRMIFGLLAGLLFDGIKKVTTKDQFILTLIPVSLFLSLVHSFLVLSCVYLFNFQEILTNLSLEELNPAYGYVLIVLGSLVGTQVLGEMIIAGLLSPFVISLIYKQNVVKYNGKEKILQKKYANMHSFRISFKETLNELGGKDNEN